MSGAICSFNLLRPKSLHANTNLDCVLVISSVAISKHAQLVATHLLDEPSEN